MTHPVFSKPTHTIGDLYSAVLAIHDGAAARAFYEDYVGWTLVHAKDARYRTQDVAEQLVKSNIGWIFGEGMDAADVAMWVEACGAAHPIFGTVIPSPDEAFRAGARFAGK